MTQTSLHLPEPQSALPLQVPLGGVSDWVMQDDPSTQALLSRTVSLPLSPHPLSHLMGNNATEQACAWLGVLGQEAFLSTEV